jgi:carnitine-CoA ligase
LFEFFSEHLPYFAIPRYVQIRESLPTTDASGRVRKHVLRAEGVTSDTWDLESLAQSAARR